MRKFLIGAAIAASALTAAAPAAAQWAPQPQQPYGYNGYNGYNNNGYNNGYNNNYGNGGMLLSRVDRIRQQIDMLSRRNMLSPREADRLNREAFQLRQRVQRVAWNGVSPNERYDVERRIAQLEQRVRINANDRDGRYDRNYNNGYRRY